uniref:Putative secreted protein n=1 Tax=Ixodes ricinus TaxID=34613 RepID=A0A6B0U0G3_IXORI
MQSQLLILLFHLYVLRDCVPVQRLHFTLGVGKRLHQRFFLYFFPPFEVPVNNSGPQLTHTTCNVHHL